MEGREMDIERFGVWANVAACRCGLASEEGVREQFPLVSRLCVDH